MGKSIEHKAQDNTLMATTLLLYVIQSYYFNSRIKFPQHLLTDIVLGP